MKQEVTPNGYDLLWTNPNPTTSMSDTSINIPNMSKYSIVWIVLGGISSNGNHSSLALNGEACCIYGFFIRGNNGGCATYRRILTPSGDSLSISNCDYFGYDQGGRFFSTSNSNLIPKYVYGVK